MKGLLQKECFFLNRSELQQNNFKFFFYLLRSCCSGYGRLLVDDRLFCICVLFRTHSISEVRFFRETNYDAGTFYEKIRFHSHKDKTQGQKVRLG